MKNRKTKLTVLLSLMLLACLLLSSCGSKKGLTGTWEGLGGLVTLVLRDDGTYTSTNSFNTLTGGSVPTYKYTYDNQSFTIYFTCDGYDENDQPCKWEYRKTYFYNLEDNGDTLTINASQVTRYKNGKYDSTEPKEPESIIMTRKK